MDDHDRDELHALRLRAYGPAGAADPLAGDAGAQERLRELEIRARASRAPEGARALEPAAPAAPLAPRIADSADPGSAPAETPPSRRGAPRIDRIIAATARARRSHRRRRVVALLWAGSLVVVAAVAVSATLAVGALAPRDSLEPAAQPVAIVPVDPAFEWPAALGDSTGAGTGGGIGFEDFAGLTMVTTRAYWPTTDGDVCLVVVPTDAVRATGDQSDIDAPLYSGCGAGDFPATVVIAVTGEMPPALREQFPTGTALQFVLDGENVRVFSDVP